MKRKEIIGVLVFYIFIVIGVIAVNYRLSTFGQTKSTNEVPVQIVQDVNPSK